MKMKSSQACIMSKLRLISIDGIPSLAWLAVKLAQIHLFIKQNCEYIE